MLNASGGNRALPKSPLPSLFWNTLQVLPFASRKAGILKPGSLQAAKLELNCDQQGRAPTLAPAIRPSMLREL